MSKYNNKSICKKTNKIRFNSESSATRSVNKYEDIKRAYYCSYCDGFHLTSETIGEVLENGELELKEENDLLRKKINTLESQAINSKIGINKFKKLSKKFELFIMYHPEISKDIKKEFGIYKKEK